MPLRGSGCHVFTFLCICFLSVHAAILHRVIQSNQRNMEYSFNLHLHKVIRIRAEVVERLVIYRCIEPAKYGQSAQISHAWFSINITHLFETFAAPRTGFAAAFGFFFLPDALSRCSFCFSFASVVSTLAVLRTSTSRKGIASSRTWCSRNAAYSGLLWCRLITYSMILLERSTKSSFVRGCAEMRESSSEEDVPS